MGTGTSGIASRRGAATRLANASSAMIDVTSPAKPPVFQLLSVTITRPVRRTDPRIVSVSSGRRVRRSITSTSMPAWARCSAARRASRVMYEDATTVTSGPSRAMRAWPNGTEW